MGGHRSSAPFGSRDEVGALDPGGVTEAVGYLTGVQGHGRHTPALTHCVSAMYGKDGEGTGISECSRIRTHLRVAIRA